MPISEQRAHEDQEVRDEEEEDLEDVDERRRVVDHLVEACEQRCRCPEPGDVRPGRRREDLNHVDDGDRPADQERQLEEEAPRPGAAPVRDVLLAQARVVGAEEARPRDDAAHEDVGEAAEGDDREERDEERPADAPPVVVVEPVEGERRRHQRDERRGAGQPAQLLRKDGVRLDENLARPRGGGGNGRHVSYSSGDCGKPARARPSELRNFLELRLDL